MSQSEVSRKRKIEQPNQGKQPGSDNAARAALLLRETEAHNGNSADTSREQKSFGSSKLGRPESRNGDLADQFSMRLKDGAGDRGFGASGFGEGISGVPRDVSLRLRDIGRRTSGSGDGWQGSRSSASREQVAAVAKTQFSARMKSRGMEFPSAARVLGEGDVNVARAAKAMFTDHMRRASQSGMEENGENKENNVGGDTGAPKRRRLGGDAAPTNRVIIAAMAASRRAVEQRKQAEAKEADKVAKTKGGGKGDNSSDGRRHEEETEARLQREEEERRERFEQDANASSLDYGAGQMNDGSWVG